jgi:hypothetical protein
MRSRLISVPAESAIIATATPLTIFKVSTTRASIRPST